MRLCWNCDKKKPDDEFYADQLQRSRARCKVCKRAKVAIRYKRLKVEKKCFHCAKPMELDDTTLCKGCKEKRRSEYHENGEERREYGRNRTRSLKLAAFEAYDGVCSCCGETHDEFLTIDHIAGNGAEHRRALPKRYGKGGGAHMYRWLRDNEYPKGFQVLCFNCNFAKGHFGECPHEAERRLKAG